MHIVLANQWYPPESGWGGVAMWNYAMAHAYRTLGHFVTIIAARTSSSIVAFQESDGICIHRLLVHDKYHWRRLPVVGRYVREAQQLAYARRVDRALRELDRRQPVDVTEFAEVNAEGFFFARKPSTPFVVRCHMPTFVLKRYYTPREMPFDTRITGACEKNLIRRAHVLTAPSNEMARVMASECNVPLKDIAVIPNALSIQEFQSAGPTSHLTHASLDRPITILYVGRLERLKGVTSLAEAVPLVVHQIPQARFILIGGDRQSAIGTSQRMELEKCFKIWQVESNVTFSDLAGEPTFAEWYRSADICVVPSLYESFSYTSAQAMAAGKPVIASRIGGIPETVEDGVTGVLVAPGNVEELAEAIIRLARDPGLRERMGKAGRERVKREFDPQSIAGRNLEQYERARQRFCRMVV